MKATLKKIFALFSSKERKGLGVLSLLILLMALLEASGVATIIPFMTVLGNPSAIENNQLLHWAYQTFAFQGSRSFLIFLGFVVLIFLLASNAYSAFATWYMLRFIYRLEYTLSEKLLHRYLRQPYVFFLNRNTSELSKNILREVGNVVTGVLIPGIQALAKAVVATCLLLLLVASDPFLACLIGISLLSCYAGIYKIVRRNLARLGAIALESNKDRYKMASEALGGIKEIKLMGREDYFTSLYGAPAQSYALSQAKSEVLSQIPRFALEVVAFGGILILILYLLTLEKGVSEILPLMSLYAFAGYRLMPALQQVFSGITRAKFNLPSLDLLEEDLCRGQESHPLPATKPSSAPLTADRSIALDHVTYRYPGRKEAVLDDLSLEIRAKTTVGFAGTTGSGKTTTVDILLGLLSPEKGALRVDGTPIEDSNLGQWQRKLGYVPQHFFLCDDTVVRNIAFGVPDQEIDLQAVESALRTARIYDFVVKELPEGLNTVIGERGVRLSGGQRQRLGIARALYHDPEILVLDEATSSLDVVTENAIMEAIRALAHKKTILMIAHRISTLAECDVIHVMDGGKVVQSGTYDQLMASSARFQTMVKQLSAQATG